MKPLRRFRLIFAILGMTTMFALYSLFEQSQVEEIRYSEFRSLLAQQQITIPIDYNTGTARCDLG